MSGKTARDGFFGELLYFLKRNWLWWVIPIALVLLAVLALVIAGSGTDSGFEYPIF